MTVAELIGYLVTLPPDVEVYVRGPLDDDLAHAATVRPRQLTDADRAQIEDHAISIGEPEWKIPPGAILLQA